ncbi:lipocalin family protein [Opacimonas viscosa]|uniref:Outer membrane lipoprotein Blc n=1 Tax=Opacimonas viscosa TaxID=2961944 RepID=A0AA41WX44_9ALTE|nr:lipocalin family protein [Opacimonas viscosa]MCP3428149.1 lipocalin family protein [Opacimonas viscosa]
MLKSLVLVIVLSLLSACTSVPENITPVSNFAKERYLGKWYEIARLDHSFERGLQGVTAEYGLQPDGGISVLNKGYDIAEQRWAEAKGKAYFVDSEQVGHLKVSFFGPFYASYVIAELDEDYQYALVTGPDTDYLWILARTPVLAETTISRLIKKAEQAGFNTDGLIFVEHK